MYWLSPEPAPREQKQENTKSHKETSVARPNEHCSESERPSSGLCAPAISDVLIDVSGSLTRLAQHLTQLQDNTVKHPSTTGVFSRSSSLQKRSEQKLQKALPLQKNLPQQAVLIPQQPKPTTDASRFKTLKTDESERTENFEEGKVKQEKVFFRRSLPNDAFYLTEAKQRAIRQQEQHKEIEPVALYSSTSNFQPPSDIHKNIDTGSSEEDVMSLDYPFLPKKILEHRLRHYKPIREGLYLPSKHRNQNQPHERPYRASVKCSGLLQRTGTRLDYFTSARKTLLPIRTSAGHGCQWDAFSFVGPPSTKQTAPWILCHRETALPVAQALHLETSAGLNDQMSGSSDLLSCPKAISNGIKTCPKHDTT